jgi:hypothetical protein
MAHKSREVVGFSHLLTRFALEDRNRHHLIEHLVERTYRSLKKTIEEEWL